MGYERSGSSSPNPEIKLNPGLRALALCRHQAKARASPGILPEVPTILRILLKPFSSVIFFFTCQNAMIKFSFEKLETLVFECFFTVANLPY